jgi:hypothetical protein
MKRRKALRFMKRGALHNCSYSAGIVRTIMSEAFADLKKELSSPPFSSPRI